MLLAHLDINCDEDLVDWTVATMPPAVKELAAKEGKDLVWCCEYHNFCVLDYFMRSGRPHQ